MSPEKLIELGPQDMVLPQQLAPSVAAVRVRAIHDGARIGFLLEWDDTDVNDLTVRVDDYRDACAVLLAPGTADEALRPMGSATTPATLLHWKADWQRDVDQGRQGLEAVYPNRTIDVYPIVYTTPPDDVDISTYQDAGATEWLPGVHVGNPMSAPTRTSPVEKAIAYGFSTTTTAANARRHRPGRPHADRAGGSSSPSPSRRPTRASWRPDRHHFHRGLRRLVRRDTRCRQPQMPRTHRPRPERDALRCP